MPNTVNVAVVGAGKMGLPLACTFAKNGAHVVACDVNQQAVDLINEGTCPFDEPGVPELLSSVVASGNLRASTKVEDEIGQSDVVVVIVPVLLTQQKGPDLSIINSIAEMMSRSLKPGAMVVFETTLPIGGTRQLGGIIDRGGLEAGKDYDLVFSPERVKSQKVLAHLNKVPKIVGGINARSAERAEKFYATYLNAPVINVETLEASEYSKLAGMIYRDVNIALANELATYADLHGIDIDRVRAASNTDGEAYILTPGIGVGGHCTPVYPHFALHEADSRGFELPITTLSRAINDRQPADYLDRLGDISGKRLCVLGLAFRPQVKESAYSPAFSLVSEAKARGAVVTVCDPLYSAAELEHYGFLSGPPQEAQILVLNTFHDAFKDLDFGVLAAAGVEAILDGRHAWNPSTIEQHGIRYVAIAR